MHTTRWLALGGLMLALLLGLSVACGGDDGDNEGTSGELLAPGDYDLTFAADVTFQEQQAGASLRGIVAQETQQGTIEGSGRMTLVEGGDFTLGDLGLNLKIDVEGEQVTIVALEQDADQPSTGHTDENGTSMELNVVGSSPETGEALGASSISLESANRQLQTAEELAMDAAAWEAEGVQTIYTFDPTVPGGWLVEVREAGDVGPTPTETPQAVLGEPLQSFADRIGISEEDYSSIQIDIDPVTGPTTIYSQSGTQAGLSLPHLNITQTFGARLSIEEVTSERYRRFMEEGGLGEPSPAPTGNVLIVGGVVEGSIPLNDPNHSYTISAVLQDGDPQNDFTENPGFDWDFFLGTDFWIEGTWSPAAGQWTVTASDVVDGFRQPRDVSVSLVTFPIELSGGEEPNTLFAFFLSEDDIAAPAPREFEGFRVTTFGTDPNLSYGPEVSGGDVSGEDPTQPLLTLPTIRITLSVPDDATTEPGFAPATVPPLEVP